MDEMQNFKLMKQEIEHDVTKIYKGKAESNTSQFFLSVIMLAKQVNLL
jgi:hypothetical protein